MKTLFTCLSVSIISIFIIGAKSLNENKETLETKVINLENKIKELEAPKKELKLVNGKHSIQLSVLSNGAGIWLTNGETNKMIAIYTFDKYQNGIGIYHNWRETKGLNVCLSVDEGGEPFIQLVNDKTSKIMHYSQENLQIKERINKNFEKIQDLPKEIK